MADGIKIVAKNRKTLHRYHILEKVEAGICLTGSEVKSLRDGNVSIAEAFARPQNGEMFMIGMRIAEYKSSGYASHEPDRKRKLLLHKKEIRRLSAEVAQKGLSIVPLSIYFKRGLAKVELALVRGKKMYDKREAIKEREQERDAQRRLGRRR